MPSVIKRTIFGWWAINDFVIVQKIDYPIMAYAEIDIIFPPPFSFYIKVLLVVFSYDYNHLKSLDELPFCLWFCVVYYYTIMLAT